MVTRYPAAPRTGADRGRNIRKRPPFRARHLVEGGSVDGEDGDEVDQMHGNLTEESFVDKVRKRSSKD